MKITGTDFIHSVVGRLKKQNILPYDTAIVNEIRSLSWQEINRICMLGEGTPPVKNYVEPDNFAQQAAAQNTGKS
jgi:hypothetical protein